MQGYLKAKPNQTTSVGTWEAHSGVHNGHYTYDQFTFSTEERMTAE